MKKNFYSVIIFTLLAANLIGCNSKDPLYDFCGDPSYVSPKNVIVEDAQNQMSGLESDWYKGTTIYHVWLKGFTDSNGDGIGDFNGVTSQLDYIKNDVGADTIWLSPHMECAFKGSNMHGYDTTDYYAVNSSFGTEEDLKTLISTAHQKGIKIIFDFVPNHCSSANQWFKDSVADKTLTGKFNWFLWSTYPRDWSPMSSSGWARSYLNNRYYYHAFSDNMPDLNYRNYEVREEMKNVVRYWLNFGFDGLRIDAVRYLIENDGSQQDNIESVDFFKELRSEVLDKYTSPKFMIGETWIENNRPVLDTYFGNGKSLHAVLDFDQGRKMVRSVRGNYNQNKFYSNSEIGAYGTFLANHDEYCERIGTEFDSDTIRMKQATALSLLRPTIPIIYYGQEIGQTNENLDGDMRLRGNFKASLKNNQKVQENSLLKLNQAINSLRAEFNDYFKYGTLELAEDSSDGITKDVIGYTLSVANSTQKLFCVFNFASESLPSATFNFNNQTFASSTKVAKLICDSEDSASIQFNGNQVTVNCLAPHAFRVYLIGSDTLPAGWTLWDDETYEEGESHKVPVTFTKMYLRGSMNSWKASGAMTKTDSVNMNFTQEIKLTAKTSYEFKFEVSNGSPWKSNWGAADAGVNCVTGQKYSLVGSGENILFIPKETRTYTITFEFNNGKPTMVIQ